MKFLKPVSNFLKPTHRTYKWGLVKVDDITFEVISVMRPHSDKLSKNAKELMKYMIKGK